MESIPEVPDLRGEVEMTSGRPIYTGPYSCVYRGKLRRDGQMVAIKVLSAVNGSAPHTMYRKLRRERKTWGGLNHPNILPLYGFADDDEAFQPFGALISPWREHGDASSFLAENGERMSIDDRTGLWRDVVQGVNYLHLHWPCLIHGDLKPRNILIDDSGHAQICDFGLVRVFLDEGNSGMTTTTQHTGTERYLAYELVVAEEEPTPTTATDIHAVGCIGLEFIFSQIPYSSRKNNYGGLVYLDIRKKKPPAVRPRNISPRIVPIWKLVESCWNLDPRRRPPAALLLAGLAEMAQTQTREYGYNHKRDQIYRNDSLEPIIISTSKQEPPFRNIGAPTRWPVNITPQGEQSETPEFTLTECDLETAWNTYRNAMSSPFEDDEFGASHATPTTVSMGRLTHWVPWHPSFILDIPDHPANFRPEGWFNRRGDQLWFNGGQYKPAVDEYPVHLRNYPDVGFWMNEFGAIIDASHQLVRSSRSRPKLKGILKRRGLL